MKSFIALSVLLLVGYVLRSRLRVLRWLYLPSCVIAGLLGLAIFQAAPHVGLEIPPAWTLGWDKLPGILINVVFACLFLGVPIPAVKKIWRRAGPQLAYGQVVAWGQYVVGIGIFLVLIQFIWPALPAMFGGILPVGFEGGHGTATGLGKTFESFDWQQGKDLALLSATFGLCSAVIVGMILVNWAIRRGHVVRQKRTSPQDVGEDDSIAIVPLARRPEAGRLTVSSDSIETFTLHLGLVAIALLIGYLIQLGLVAAGGASGNETFGKVMSAFPLFPLCMIGGLIVQLWEQKFDKNKLIDHGLTRRIQNASLDFLVVAAIATIHIAELQQYILPLMILMAAGIAWNVFCVLVLARFMLPNAWFERAMAEMGQSMGVTATGLLLLRVVDPDYETPAAEAFAYKQILHEPFMGGGLWTSAAIPLLAIWGGWWVFLIAAATVTAWLLITFLTPIINNKGK